MIDLLFALCFRRNRHTHLIDNKMEINWILPHPVIELHAAWLSLFHLSIAVCQIEFLISSDSILKQLSLHSQRKIDINSHTEFVQPLLLILSRLAVVQFWVA